MSDSQPLGSGTRSKVGGAETWCDSACCTSL